MLKKHTPLWVYCYILNVGGKTGRICAYYHVALSRFTCFLEPVYIWLMQEKVFLQKIQSFYRCVCIKEASNSTVLEKEYKKNRLYRENKTSGVWSRERKKERVFSFLRFFFSSSRLLSHVPHLIGVWDNETDHRPQSHETQWDTMRQWDKVK